MLPGMVQSTLLSSANVWRVVHLHCRLFSVGVKEGTVPFAANNVVFVPKEDQEMCISHVVCISHPSTISSNLCHLPAPCMSIQLCHASCYLYIIPVVNFVKQ